MHLNYQKSELDGVLSFQYPTISMDFEFRSDPAGKMEWILNRAKTHKLHNGRYDMHIQMVDDDGDLVATVRQSSLVFAHKRGKSRETKSTL